LLVIPNGITAGNPFHVRVSGYLSFAGSPKGITAGNPFHVRVNGHLSFAGSPKEGVSKA
jgi:hypothetical protein